MLINLPSYRWFRPRQAPPGLWNVQKRKPDNFAFGKLCFHAQTSANWTNAVNLVLSEVGHTHPHHPAAGLTDSVIPFKRSPSMQRRQFLQTSGLGALAAAVPQTSADSASPPKRLAVVTTVWRNRSHAWHMAERFLHGYPIGGRWHRPPFKIVSAYIDQFPEGELGRSRALEFGFPIVSSIDKALRIGGNQLNVDAVLIIGEHGDYDINQFGQKKYPRYEFFKAVTDVFRKDGRAVPVFNDKHLSWRWDWAKEMVAISEELDFGFAAGSSLPVTWRMPSVDMPLNAPVEEMMCLAMGGIDSYDFHALEVIQCMAERRRGGETGVESVQGLRGDSVWQAMESGSWSAGGWDPTLFAACLNRCQTLRQPGNFSHRYPTPQQIREWVQDPLVYRIAYRDGTKATMLLMNGLVSDFTFSARITGQELPLSTLFYLPPTPNVTYSAELMARAEKTFLTGTSPNPIERTLLTSGLVEAGCRSIGTGQKTLKTPHLDLEYKPRKESLFARS